MPEPLSLSTMQEVRSALAAPTFSALAMRDGLRHLRRASFPAGDLTLAQLSVFGEIELAEGTPAGAAVVLRPEPEMLVYLSAGRGQGEIAVAGIDRGAVDRVTADLIASLRDPAPPEDHVPVTFWAREFGQPMNPRRMIPAPAWEEVRGNYGEATQVVLDGLMAATEPGPGGLLLWHGEAGTGKSYALRALAREWRAWCDTHFVTDADAFLGSQAGYLLSALLREARDDSRWRLIVLEDAGELLAADARAVAGQALSRLLNLTDGLLGAGLCSIVLLTTNEPLRRMHPAVIRPGRAWAEVEFPALTAGEANEWLDAQGSDARVERQASLAELFALADGRPISESSTLGFAA